MHRGRDDALAERTADVADGLHDRPVHVVSGHLAHEPPVDLHEVHRQRLQVAEGRQPGAEVVQAEAAALAAQALGERARGRQDGDGEGLGHLEADALARDAGARELASHELRESLVVDRALREVDAHPVRAAGLGEPLQGAAQHPAIDARGEAVALGHRHEAGGRHQPALAVGHAQHHLVVLGLGGAGGERHHRIGEQHQDVVVQCRLDAPQPAGLAGHPIGAGVVRAVDVDPVTAGVLRRVARVVGAHHQLPGAAAARGDGYQPDARADAEHLLLPYEAELLDGRAQLVRHLAGLLHRAVLEQQRELVAAEPRQHVALAHRGLHPRGDLAQQLVARGVAARVVHDLEAVEIQVQQRGLARRVARARDHLVEQVLERAAVEQVGEGVVPGLVLQAPRQLVGFGDVEHEAFQREAIVADGRGATLLPHPAHLAGAGDDAVAQLERAPGEARVGDRLPGVGTIVGVRDAEDERLRHLARLRRRVAGEGATALADELGVHRAAGVACPVGHAREVAHQRGQAPLALGHRVQRAPALGDVQLDAADAHHRAGVVQDRELRRAVGVFPVGAPLSTTRRSCSSKSRASSAGNRSCTSRPSTCSRSRW